MSKILFIDVDGTLVDYDSVLPVSAVDAIRKANNLQTEPAPGQMLLIPVS